MYLMHIVSLVVHFWYGIELVLVSDWLVVVANWQFNEHKTMKHSTSIVASHDARRG